MDNPSPKIKNTTPIESLCGWLDYEGNKSSLSFQKKSNNITSYEVFTLIRDIKDPEYPLSLGALRVVEPSGITVIDDIITVKITPTVPHCNHATLIGLAIKSQLNTAYGNTKKILVEINKGTHDNDEAINKQLRDKERIAAALENPAILPHLQYKISKEPLERCIDNLLEYNSNI